MVFQDPAVADLLALRAREAKGALRTRGTVSLARILAGDFEPQDDE
jgi:hypothetical protein